MTLTTHQEEKLRRGLGVIVNEAPPGKDFHELAEPTVVSISPNTRTGLWVAAATLVGVFILFSPLLLMSDPEPVIGVPEEPVAPVANESSEVEEPTTVEEPAIGERLPVVVEVSETGDLIGLDRRHAFRSTDGGETWTEILVDGGADLIDLMPDGTVIAVRNGTEREWGVFGPDTWVREPGFILRYDPVAGDWESSELPRPEFPVSDPVPAPMDGSTGCGLAGIHWTWDALSMVIGDRIVIAGEQRVVEENVCDESLQFFWVSDDGGDSWTIIEETGIDGYIVGLTGFDGRYVAYGSDIVWYSWTANRTFQVWTSTDLAVWEEAELDLSLLPDRAFPGIFPDNERSWGSGYTVSSSAADGVLRLSVPMVIARPGPPADISSLEELNEWAEANGQFPTDQDLLDLLEIDFPLDEEELERLNSWFLTSEPGAKRLIIETSDGVNWTTRYDGS